MTDQKFSNGDRIKVTFEAAVSYASLDDIHYITFSNGQEIEFPEEILPDDVVIEKIAKPLENGWYLFHNPFSPDRVHEYKEGMWQGSVSISSEDTITRLEPVK